MIFTKLFARFVVKNYLNAIFGANKFIFIIKIIIFIKKNKKTVVFFKTYWQNPYIFMFLRENFPKLAKILRLSSKFWRVILKNVNMLLKN